MTIVSEHKGPNHSHPEFKSRDNAQSHPSRLRRAFSAWRAIPRSRKELLESTRLLTTLRAAGWHDSLRNETRFHPQSALPLLTYGALAYMDAFLRPTDSVLEFGSGGSTVWLAARVGRVVTLEDQDHWAGMVPRLPNVEMRIVSCSGGDWYNDGPDALYSTGAADSGPFDAILVDGKARTDCAKEALKLISEDGFIVLDDLHDPLVRPAMGVLDASNLKVIEFWGLRPGSGEFGGTAIYVNRASIGRVPEVGPVDLV